jgi:hypothetical protein
METGRAVIHRKTSASPRQLPITIFAHKAAVVGAADYTAIDTTLGMTTKGRRPASVDRA